MATEIMFEKKLSVTYYNAFGILGVIKAGFSWNDSQEKFVSASFPLKGIPFSALYENYIKTVYVDSGKYGGSSYSLRKNVLSTGFTIYSGPMDSFKTSAVFENVHVESVQSTSGLAIDDSNYLNLKTVYRRIVESPYEELPYKYRLDLSPSVMLDFSNAYFGFDGSAYALFAPFIGFTVKPYLSMGIISPHTPFDYWYKLGSYPDFASAWGPITVQKFICAGIEMRLQFTSGIFLTVMADSGKFWEDSSNWNLSGPVVDLGIGIGYQISGSSALKVYYFYDPLNGLSNVSFGIMSNY
jgi:hypothetical protein